MTAKNLLPVINSHGAIVGHAATGAHKKAAEFANSKSVRQEFRTVEGRRQLCWIAA
jgi:hypothetical protein